jgi:hypothetical protein
VQTVWSTDQELGSIHRREDAISPNPRAFSFVRTMGSEDFLIFLAMAIYLLILREEAPEYLQA